MTECINNRLCNERFVTYRTMLTLGKTRLGASGSYRRIDYLGVSESINYSLCEKNLVTFRAMFSFSKTCFCASRSNRRIDYLGVRVTIRRQAFLLITAPEITRNESKHTNKHDYKRNSFDYQLSHNVFTFTFKPVGILWAYYTIFILYFQLFYRYILLFVKRYQIFIGAL